VRHLISGRWPAILAPSRTLSMTLRCDGGDISQVVNGIASRYNTMPFTPATICVDDKVSDEELTALLHRAYVDAGFTDPTVAEKLFAPDAVRARGTIITARDSENGRLLGIVILVAPYGAARQIAVDSEAEMHLLAVSPDSRRQGVGRRLVDTLIELAISREWQRVVLSTQEHMRAAQALYKQAGFSRAPERDWMRADRRFLVFVRA